MARILVIEDDTAIAAMLVDFLESRGYTVAVATDGAKGIQNVDLRRPDAIVLDLMLPVINGVEVARRLRRDPATRDIPILSVTAVDGPDDLAEIVMVDAVLSKPFSLDAIEAELARLLAPQSEDDQREVTTSGSETVPRQ